MNVGLGGDELDLEAGRQVELFLLLLRRERRVFNDVRVVGASERGLGEYKEGHRKAKNGGGPRIRRGSWRSDHRVFHPRVRWRGRRRRGKSVRICLQPAAVSEAIPAFMREMRFRWETRWAEVGEEMSRRRVVTFSIYYPRKARTVLTYGPQRCKCGIQMG